MKSLIIGLMAILAFSFPANAQKTTAKSVKDANNGFGFTVPNGWICQDADGTYAFTNDAKTANIVLKKHSYKDYNDFTQGEGAFERDGYQKLVETLDLGDGNYFDRVAKTINGNNLIFDVLFMVSKYGGGAIVMGVSTDKDSSESAIAGITELVKTIAFTEVKTTPQDAATKNAFGGKKFRYLYSNNGYRESKTIYLCKSGAYVYQSESGSFSEFGTGVTHTDDRGTWQVNKNGSSITLTLRSQTGEPTKQFQVTARQASNEIGLNGDRFFVSEQNECQ